MKLINKYGKDKYKENNIVIYDVEGIDRGIYSAIELVMSLKDKIPVVESITINPFSDCEWLDEDKDNTKKFEYDSYDDFEANQEDFLCEEVELIWISGIEGLNDGWVSINLETKTIAFTFKPFEKAVALAEALNDSLTRIQ